MAPLPLATALLILLGASVALYPAAASWFSALAHSRETDRYVETVAGLHPGQRDAELEAAERYNTSLADGTRVVDPFSAVAEATVKTDDPYWTLLDPTGDGVLARISIPLLDLSLPAYHGTGADVLLEGIGHLQGTALPVGGAGTHSVLTGHRGLPQAEMFTRLDELEPGDAIEINGYADTLVYRVTGTVEVLPTDTGTLHPVAGRDLLSLVTCTPVGINTHRIIVTAERVLPAPAEAGVAVNAVGFPGGPSLF